MDKEVKGARQGKKKVAEPGSAAPKRKRKLMDRDKEREKEQRERERERDNEVAMRASQSKVSRLVDNTP